MLLSWKKITIKCKNIILIFVTIGYLIRELPYNAIYEPTLRFSFHIISNLLRNARLLKCFLTNCRTAIANLRRSLVPEDLYPKLDLLTFSSRSQQPQFPRDQAVLFTFSLTIQNTLKEKTLAVKIGLQTLIVS